MKSVIVIAVPLLIAIALLCLTVKKIKEYIAFRKNSTDMTAEILEINRAGRYPEGSVGEKLASGSSYVLKVLAENGCYYNIVASYTDASSLSKGKEIKITVPKEASGAGSPFDDEINKLKKRAAKGERMTDKEKRRLHAAVAGRRSSTVDSVADLIKRRVCIAGKDGYMREILLFVVLSVIMIGIVLAFVYNIRYGNIRYPG